MKIRFYLYSFSSLLLTFLYFIITKNILFSLILLIINSLLFFLVIEKMIKDCFNLTKITYECINFVNNFVIGLSINSSITLTLANLTNNLSNSLNNQLDNLTHLTDEEKIFYLENYFACPYYSLFLKLIKQYIEEGCNILDSTKFLLLDGRLVEKTLKNHINLAKKKTLQFVFMWGLAFSILVILKIFLGNYYNTMMNMNFYPISIFMLFMIFLASLYLHFNHVTNLKFIDGAMKYENI
ncbi:MAG: hypothetical protein ACTTID_02460 [Bacillales bacterium]